jgi:hypothetical protein
MRSEDYLQALETVGRILLFTPVFVSLLLFISRASGREPFAGSGAFFANGLMMSAGFFTLLYVAVLRFRQELKKAE